MFGASLLAALYFYKGLIFREQNIYYYGFSTIAQGFIGLAGFLGAVTVYRMQLYENELTKKTEEVYEILAKDMHCKNVYIREEELVRQAVGRQRIKKVSLHCR